jgi:hypothetical protein
MSARFFMFVSLIANFQFKQCETRIENIMHVQTLSSRLQ